MELKEVKLGIIIIGIQRRSVCDCRQFLGWNKLRSKWLNEFCLSTFFMKAIRYKEIEMNSVRNCVIGIRQFARIFIAITNDSFLWWHFCVTSGIDWKFREIPKINIMYLNISFDMLASNSLLNNNYFRWLQNFQNISNRFS